jgi:hypothetical protein
MQSSVSHSTIHDMASDILRNVSEETSSSTHQRTFQPNFTVGPTNPLFAAENLVEFTTSENPASLIENHRLGDSARSSYVKSTTIAKKQSELVHLTQNAVGLPRNTYANDGAESTMASYKPWYEPQTLCDMNTESDSWSIISKFGKRRIPQQEEKSNGNEVQTSSSFISKRPKREGLCEECAKFDFEAIFARADAELSEQEQRRERGPWKLIRYLGIPLASLGNRLAHAESSSCKLCRLLSLHRFPSGESRNYQLWAFPSAWGCGFMKTDSIPTRLLCGSTKFLAALPEYTEPDKLLQDKELKAHWESNGYIFRAAKPGANLSGIWGREISQSVDFTLVMEWLQFCRRHHRDDCVRRNMHLKESLQGFRLIDCNTKETVSRPWTETYAALSYVWGPVESGEAAWPRVVTHAILVTMALGIKYLWVDRYCIDQNDPVQKHGQISKMNLIYEGAEITIINVAGVNAQSGLPGIENEVRPQQPKAKIGDNVLVSTLRSPREHIKNSLWSTRGWTYQEGVLSRRRLVFTKEQVYFECGGIAVCETVFLPLAEFHTESLRRFRCFFRPGVFSGKSEYNSFHSEPGNLEEKLYQIQAHSINYRSRNLLFLTDSLHGFGGILQRFSLQSKGKLGSIFGLPVMLESYQQLIFTFAFSVCGWGHFFNFDQDPNEFSYFERIPHFPSWTWAGWKGNIGWKAGDRCGGDWRSFLESVRETKKYVADISLKLLGGRFLGDLEIS